MKLENTQFSKRPKLNALTTYHYVIRYDHTDSVMYSLINIIVTIDIIDIVSLETDSNILIDPGGYDFLLEHFS